MAIHLHGRKMPEIRLFGPVFSEPHDFGDLVNFS